MKFTAILRAACLLFLAPIALPLLSAAEPASQVFEYDDVDVKPTPKRRIKMSFPGSTRRDGAKPEITLRFVVSEGGAVSNIVIVKFSHPDLIEEALDAYEKARFNPGMKDGQAVSTRMVVTESLR